MEGTRTDARRQAQTKRIRIRSGQIYLAEDVREALKIASVTLNCWIEQGLRCSQPGTKSRYFLGDDIIEWLFQNEKPK